MRASSDTKPRFRAHRATPGDDEPQRRVSAGVEWPRPGRRARILAAALAIAFAASTFAVVSLVWRGAAAPARPMPRSVEVRIVVPSPLALPPLPQASR